MLSYKIIVVTVAKSFDRHDFIAEWACCFSIRLFEYFNFVVSAGEGLTSTSFDSTGSGVDTTSMCYISGVSMWVAFAGSAVRISFDSTTLIVDGFYHSL